MSEREMLERASKAAGARAFRFNSYGVGEAEFNRPWSINGGPRQDDWGWVTWNPLTDDKDALRLAVKLGIGVQCHVYQGSGYVLAQSKQGRNEAHVVNIEPGDDPYAATRLAITRAAAALAPTAQGE